MTEHGAAPERPADPAAGATTRAAADAPPDAPTDPTPGATTHDATDASGAAFDVALVEEATKKSPVAWLTAVPDQRRWYDAPPDSCAVWLMWHEGAAYVVHGGAEQPAYVLAGARRVAVAVRSKDQGGRLVTWLADAATVAPGSPGWAAVVPLLLGKRLNLPDGEAAAARWAAESTVTRLTPTDRLLEGPGRYSTESGAAPPPPTPATTLTPLPFAVGTATTKPPRGRRPPLLRRRRRGR